MAWCETLFAIAAVCVFIVPVYTVCVAGISGGQVENAMTLFWLTFGSSLATVGVTTFLMAYVMKRVFWCFTWPCRRSAKKRDSKTS